MKSELRHLLDKLKAERPGFKQLIFSHNGRASAVYSFAPINFESLDDLEAWLYRPAQTTPQEHEQCQCEKCVQLRAAKSSSPNPSLPLFSESEPRTSGFLQAKL